MSIAAVVLAAGGSTRFGRAKQLEIFRGQPLVRRAVLAAEAAKCTPIIAVAGERVAEIKLALASTTAEVIENLNWPEGISSSIRIGIAELRDEAILAAVFLTCDQPLVEGATISSLIQLADRSGKPIVAARYAKTIGIPAFFARSCFGELLALEGDKGAKRLFMLRRNDVATIPFEAGAIDLDTPEDLARLHSLG